MPAEATTKKICLPELSPPTAIQENAQLTYSALLDHYSKPRNVGSMQKADTDVGTGLVGAPACGDVMKLQIRVDPNDNTISEVKFKTFGCGSAIASSSYLTELVKGMTLEQAGRIKNTEIAKELCLPPVKRAFFSFPLPFSFFLSLFPLPIY
jgi:Fe-S cluster assembly scaffold IscU